jgi:PAS domain S-box-containing protein
MDLPLAVLVFLHALTAVLALSVTCYIWGRRGEAPGAIYLALLMIGIGEWAFCGAAEYVLRDVGPKIWCSKFSYLGINLIGVVWLLFAVHFRGKSEWLSPRRILSLCVIPIAIILLAFTNEIHLLVWPTITSVTRGGLFLLEYEHGPVYWVAFSYSYLLVVAGTVLIIQQALRLPKLYRLQSWTLVIAALIPWVTSFVYALRLGPYPEVDFTPITLTATGLLMTWNLFTLRLLDIAPMAHEVLFREIPDAVLVTDSQDRLVNLNTAGEKWYGISADSSVGTPLSIILSDSPAVLDRYNNNTDGVCEESQSDLADSRWVDVRVKQLTNRHQHKVGKILMLRDVTEQRQVELALLDLERKLERSQRMESLGILAGGIAHDFNNLLLGIMGYIDLTLMDDSLSLTHRRNLEAALKASHRAGEICQQMLAFSGKGRFILQPINLNHEVREIQRILKVSTNKGIDFRYNLQEEIPSIEADSSQIHQVLMNLSLNAIEALEEQGGIITLTTGFQFHRREDLSSPWLHQELPEGIYAFVEVSDTGSGIPPGNLSRIFDPFFTTKFIGRGLGLAAVLGITRGHGGTIQVQSEVGVGSTFRILLPISGRSTTSTA